MTEVARYPVPAAQHRVEQSIDRSRFICTVRRIGSPDDAHAFLREMTTEFADATHNCWAFVAGPPASTNSIGMSDAGEPHGTAGRPMLTVLLHSGVGEIAAIVTRYYGGTKLGTGGLVKAYGCSVQLALETLPLSERMDFLEVAMSIGYASITVFQLSLAAFEAEVLEQEYGVDVRYRIRLPRQHLAGFRATMADATRGEARIEECDVGPQDRNSPA
ncbi:MAG: YigZ family protein [bacterium]